ncbi:glutamate racemase [Acinetobacter sp. WZC-1]|uniref:glutamate racemase n=1 Tax=Acinetobacter sp. WZC-1 TaxID=3459034 RepID=UPI00403E1401
MTGVLPISVPGQRMPAASADAPIGIFDSGIGGLSIAREIARHLPGEQILYYADTAHVPYGPRNDQNIRELTAQAIEWLYRQGCKIAVVACNTASAFSLDYLRAYYGEDFPIIGLVPALKPAVLHSQSKVVAVLATPATFRGKLIRDVVENFAEPAGVTVLPVTCLALVPWIEAGLQDSEACRADLRQSLQPVIDQGADHLVLGCTHYPFLNNAIQQLYPGKLVLVDSGMAVARQTSRILTKNRLISESSWHAGNVKQLRCVLSGNNAAALEPVVARLMHADLTWSVENRVDQRD